MIRALVPTIAFWISISASAATYYAAPGGGASASCVDSTTNVCTVARCVSVAGAAGSANTCELAEGIYPGSELGASGYVLMTGNGASLDCAGAAKTCVFKPTGTNISGIRINSPTAGKTYAFDGIKIDGSSATPLDQCFYFSDASAIYSVAISDVTCKDPDIYGVRMIANEMNLTMTRVDMNASTTVSPRSYVSTVGTWAEGSVSIDTGIVTIARYDDTASTCPPCSGVVNISAQDAGETASVKNLTITVANDPATTTGYIDAILVTDIPNAVIDGNTINITGANVGSTGPTCAAASCRQVRGIRCFSTGAYSSASCTISNNSITAEAANGSMLSVGYDQTGAGDTYSANGVISNNTVNCVADGTSMHGIGFFWSSGGKATRNKVTNCGIGMISKDQPTNGADFYGNIIWGAWEEYAYAKGTTAPGFFNNDLIVTNSSGTPLLVGIDGAANSTAVEFKNNLIWSPSGATPTNLVNTASSQTLASGGATNNDWYGFSTSQWTYLGTAYTSLATWNALSVVGTDLSTAPGTIKSSPTIAADLIPKSSSALVRSGVCYLTGNCAYPDFRGYRGRIPPDIGAFQRTASD